MRLPERVRINVAFLHVHLGVSFKKIAKEAGLKSERWLKDCIHDPDNPRSSVSEEVVDDLDAYITKRKKEINNRKQLVSLANLNTAIEIQRDTPVTKLRKIGVSACQ